MTNDEDDMREIEEKVEILRQRAQAYKDFVSPPGQPPLLWQMAMLADAGFTVLPPARDSDPDHSFPELNIEMRPLEWGEHDRCLIGGERFEVMSVPPDCRNHLLRPRRARFAYFRADDPIQPAAPDFDHYVAHDRVVAYAGHVRWRSQMMVLLGSPAAERSR